jgi:hypothetical protein
VELAVAARGDPVPAPLPRPRPPTPKPCTLFPYDDFVDRVADITSFHRALMRCGSVESTVNTLCFFAESLGLADEFALAAGRLASRRC